MKNVFISLENNRFLRYVKDVLGYASESCVGHGLDGHHIDLLNVRTEKPESYEDVE